VLHAEAVAAWIGFGRSRGTGTDLAGRAGDLGEGVTELALARGYSDAMRYAQDRAAEGVLNWNRELIVEVQQRVLGAADGTPGGGLLRSGTAQVRRGISGAVVFEPPRHQLIASLVDEMCDTVREADWHPALTAAWIHVATAAVHPFKDGNGRTGRLLASLAMYRGGFRQPAFASLEEWWGQHPQTYNDAFACLGRKFDPGADVTSFVAAHIHAQLNQVIAGAVAQHTEYAWSTAAEDVVEESGLPSSLAGVSYERHLAPSVTADYDQDPRVHRRLIATRAAACLAGGIVLAGCGATSHPASKAASRQSIFSADVRSGPDIGLSLWGELRTRAAKSGEITGSLFPGGGGRPVPVSGQITGRTVNLAFHLPGGRLMSGTGTLPVGNRKTPRLVGTLTGPRPGDRGDWATAVRYPPPGSDLGGICPAPAGITCG